MKPKSFEEAMTQFVRMELMEDTKEGGFVISFPELPGCITCGDTIEDALKNAQDAKRAWLEVALEEGIFLPEPEKQPRSLLSKYKKPV